MRPSPDRSALHPFPTTLSRSSSHAKANNSSPCSPTESRWSRCRDEHEAAQPPLPLDQRQPAEILSVRPYDIEHRTPVTPPEQHPRDERRVYHFPSVGGRDASSLVNPGSEGRARQRRNERTEWRSWDECDLRGLLRSPETSMAAQPGSTVIRVEALAQAFDERIEVVLVKNLIQSHVEGMRGTARQILGRHPHRILLRVPASSAHRHRRQCSTWDRSCRS